MISEYIESDRNFMRYERAIVIGSGISGLVCARVLANHFGSVVIIDRDQIPASPSIRDGVPQGSHLHTLLPGGLEVLTNLFPQLETDLDAQGGRVAGPSDWYALTHRGKTYRISRFQPTPIMDGPRLRIQTRALLEHCIRRQLELMPNVSIRDTTMVKEPLTQKHDVAGVRLDTREHLSADLTIDASGRVSRTLRWLDQLGYPRPQETSVHCDFAYTSTFFNPPDTTSFKDAGFLISSARQGNHTKRGGSLAHVENNQWQVTLAGRLGDHPPTTMKGFLAYANTLQSPKIAKLLETATPASVPNRYKFPKSVRRHFEQLSRFPDGLLPIGDAMCHINPGYGQGMSTACRQAAELDALLTRRSSRNQPLAGLWREYFQRVHEQTRAPWLYAALSDFSRKGTTGDFPTEESQAIERLKQFNKLADEGDRDAANLVDSVFDMRLPLSAMYAAGA